MAEMVVHLEANGYVVRRPDPADRRAKRVLPTARGRAVIAIARSLMPETDVLIAGWLGADRAEPCARTSKRFAPG